MGLVILGEDLVELRVDLVAIGLSGLLCHADAAIGHERTLQGLVGLQADDLFHVFGLGVDVAGAIGGEAGHDLGLALEDASSCALLLLEVLEFAPENVSCLCGALEETLVSVVHFIVILNELADIDVLHPFGSFEAFPLISNCFHGAAPFSKGLFSSSRPVSYRIIIHNSLT